MFTNEAISVDDLLGCPNTFYGEMSILIYDHFKKEKKCLYSYKYKLTYRLYFNIKPK